MSGGIAHIKVLGAKKLAPREKGETCSVVVTVDKQQAKTKNKDATVADITWNEDFKFDITETTTELHFAIWSGGGKEFLGQATIPVATIKHSRTIDLWFRLEKRKWRFATDKVQGELHLEVRYTAGEKKLTEDDFEKVKVLGKGGFGKVMLVKKKDTERLYAMKMIRKEHVVQRQEIDHTMAEKNVLSKIKHPFIVNLRFAFQSDEKLYLLLDFINGGELFHYIQKEKRFSEVRAKFYSAEIALVIAYLHENGIIYRDLKPENILLDGDGHICLTDFGLCKEGLGLNETTGTFCGSLEYLAPEVLNPDPQLNGYTIAVDWWALGILLYEMLVGIPPFYSSDQNAMAKLILDAPLNMPQSLSPDAKDIISKLLERDVKKRLCDPAKLKTHPFYAVIDWDALYNRKIDPPFRPQVTGDDDLTNFSSDFTEMSVADSVVQESHISKSIQDQFVGFTYTPGSELTK